MSAEYELILMLDPEVEDERREEIAANAKQRIETTGSLRHSDGWGVRKLAYEVKKRNEADYRFYRFEAEPPLLEDLDHTLKITDGILRFRLFKVDPRAPLIEPPAATQLGAARTGGGRRDDRGPRQAPEAEAPAAETPSAPEAPVSPETPAEPAPAEAPAAETPSAPEAPVSPETPAEPAPAEAPAPAEEPAPAAEAPVEEPAPAAEAPAETEAAQQ